MKIRKSELAQKINKLKPIVPKNGIILAIRGILVRDGYLIATNHQTTVMAKLEGAEAETFIIPDKAFEMINNLPDGEVEISTNDKHQVRIRAGAIRNTFQSIDPEQFSTGPQTRSDSAHGSIRSADLKIVMKHVLYAIPKNDPNKIMTSMYLECENGELNVVGMDGHIVSWDRMPYEGDFKMMIPREAAAQILSLDMGEEVEIEYSKLRAIFRSEQYVVETRLVDGEYVPFRRGYQELPLTSVISREDITRAVSRAAICAGDDKKPVIMQFDNDKVNITYQGTTSDYQEEVVLAVNVQEPVRIGFDPKLLLNVLNSFSSGELHLNMHSSRAPMIIHEDDSNCRALVLPVAIT